MKVETVDGKQITIFDSREELQWYYHKKLCKGDATAQYMMEQCVKAKDVNKWLKRMNPSFRVKEP